MKNKIADGKMKKEIKRGLELVKPNSNMSGNHKIYKLNELENISDCKIVTMIPGDLVVAGCFFLKIQEVFF